MSKPIPQRLVSELAARIQPIYEEDAEYSIGVWMQMMIDVAQAFMDEHNIDDDAYDAVQQIISTING